jgi:hypothetical protein
MRNRFALRQTGLSIGSLRTEWNEPNYFSKIILRVKETELASRRQI